jgi:hypothetical protein
LQTRKITTRCHIFPGFPWLLLPLSWSVILNREESALQTALAPWRKSVLECRPAG